ncbi:MAG: transporter substrate-binding domain-containing protein, partial [Geminicoccaceae bacterium]|nr:transporter substrate-binding domain-containing protein [Geminicoccaceae bacterium]
VGMDIDMARLLAKGLFDDESKVEFVLQGSDGRIPSLVTDQVDVICQWMTITPGRAQQVAFTVPYYREGVSLMVMADGAKYATFEDIKAAGSEARVGAMQNVFIEDWVHAALPEAAVDQFDSPDSTLQALNARRVDAYLADQSAIRWLMQTTPDRYQNLKYGWMPNSYASAVRQGDPIWLDWVNTVYREAMMGVDFPAMKASYEKWFGIVVDQPLVGFPQEFR